MINIKAQQTLVKFSKNDAGKLRYVMRPESYSQLTEALTALGTALLRSCDWLRQRFVWFVVEKEKEDKVGWRKSESSVVEKEKTTQPLD